MLFQVKHVKKGVNPSSASEIFFSGKYLGAGIRIGVVAGMVALTVSNFQFPKAKLPFIFILLQLNFSNFRKL